jgi:hypothetical protein
MSRAAANARFLFLAIAAASVACSPDPGRVGRMDSVLRFAAVAEGAGCSHADCLPGASRGHEWKWEQIAKENKWVGQRLLAQESPITQAKPIEPVCDPSSAPFGGGEGTQNSPFLLCSAAQWEAIVQAPGAIYRLVGDIDFAQKTPARIPRFSGSLMGAGHRLFGARWSAAPSSALIDVNEGIIRDLWVENLRLEAVAPAQPERVALFVLRNRGAIRNVRGGEGNRIELRPGRAQREPSSEIEEDQLPVSAWRVGGLTAENSGTIEDCEWITQITVAPEAEAVGGAVAWNRGILRRVTARVWVASPKGQAVGGLSGVNSGEIFQARVDLGPFEVHGGDTRSTPSRISGYEKVGGLAGKNLGRIHEGAIWASIQGTHDVGGAVGFQLKQEAVLSEVEFNGSVTGVHPVGGLVGRNSSGARVSRCRSDALVESHANGTESAWVFAGGVVGLNESGTIELSRSAGVVSARARGMAGGIVGANSHLGGAYAQDGGRIEQCVSSARVYAAGFVGGIAGENCAECRILSSHAHGRTESGVPELHCYADRSGTETAAGGVVGTNSGTVLGAYARLSASDVTPEAGGCQLTGRVVGKGDLSQVRELASRAPSQESHR